VDWVVGSLPAVLVWSAQQLKTAAFDVQKEAAFALAGVAAHPRHFPAVMELDVRACAVTLHASHPGAHSRHLRLTP
jgi:hypothetical protein